MEKTLAPGKSGSFARNVDSPTIKNNKVDSPTILSKKDDNRLAALPDSPAVDRNNPEIQSEQCSDQSHDNSHKQEDAAEVNEDPVTDPDPGLPQVWEDVDAFLESASCYSHSKVNDDGSMKPPELPRSIELISRMVDSMIDGYVSSEGRLKFGSDPEETSRLFHSVSRLAKLTDKLGGISSSDESACASLNRTSSALHRAVSFLEDELRAILEEDSSRSSRDDSDLQSLKTKSSFNNSNRESGRCEPPQSEPSVEEDSFPLIPPEKIALMNKIANTMIDAGYEKECCLIYSVMRRSAFKLALANLGLETISMDDVQRMRWESLEGEIATWINAIKCCSSIIFPGEHGLCESVFGNHPTISRSLFSDLVRSVAFRFLDFAEATVMTKRSAEKLFKFLDMYETLRDVIAAVDKSYSDQSAEDVWSEMTAAKNRMGEAAVSIFCDLENSIRSDNGKIPVPSGAVHPLTRYTMNYLKYACEYKETLEQAFLQHHKKKDDQRDKGEDNDDNKNDNKSSSKLSPFSAQLMSVMELLDANLDMKSRLYKDPSLRSVFLMNNGRYILQKIKGSSEIRQAMGDTWCRKRSSELRQYHTNYKRETWYKLLQCLSHEGLMVNGKVSKPVLKERFKSFNAMFDEIHKTQSTWVVSDEQLQSELRVSISAVVTPAYRSFLGRFNQYLDPGRQSEKYIKYQAEDIESLIDELFDGNPTSMGRRRT